MQNPEKEQKQEREQDYHLVVIKDHGYPQPFDQGDLNTLVRVAGGIAHGLIMSGYRRIPGYSNRTIVLVKDIQLIRIEILTIREYQTDMKSNGR